MSSRSRHTIVLRVPEFAFRYRVASIAEVPSVQAQLRARHAIADARVECRECGDQRRIALVQISVTAVIEANICYQAAVRSQCEAGRGEMPRRHLEALAS